MENNIKKEIAASQIYFTKAWADSDKYFKLFAKRLSKLEDGKNVLIYDINNLSVTVKIMETCGNANFFIYGDHNINEALKAIGFKLEEVNDNNNEYNIPDMKFDRIIMNPPYGAVALKVLNTAINHLSENGECISLNPLSWLAKFNINRPFAKYRNIFNGKIKTIDIIDHATANETFGTGNSIEELGIYVLKNDNSLGLDLVNYGFTSSIEKGLYDKIDMMNSNDGVITYNKCKYNDKYGSVHGIRKPFDVVVYTWHGGVNCYDAVVRKDNKKVSQVLYFNSENERQNYLNSLNTTFMNWYWRMFVVAGDNKIISYMFRMEDYTQPWTDERFYKFFNLTADEIKYIEDTMAQYK